MAEKNENFNFPHYSYNTIDSSYLPSIAYVSLSQDGLIICEPCVSIGENVREGQLIANSRTGGVNIHSPIPGTIIAIEERSMPNGTNQECIIIQLQGNFSFIGKEMKIRSWKYDTSSRIISQIKQQGILNTVDRKVGSLAKQIEQLEPTQKTLGILLYDFDPSTTVNKTCMNFYQKEIFEGSIICARAMNADGIIFFYNSKEPIENEEIKEFLSETQHCFIPVDYELYPNASELKLQSLIQKNRHIIPEKISANMSLCMETTTALDIYYGIVYDLPVTQTFVEINGSALHEAKLFTVKIGTPIKKLLEEVGGTEKIPAKIVVNGLLKGTSINNMDTPITKYVKSITLLSTDSIPDQKQALCIHCGLCRRTCPAGLLPDVLYSYKANSFEIHDEIRLSVQFCDECALCNTTCPSRLPLYQAITQIKEEKNET